MDVTVKKFLRDPDALVAYALLAAYVLAPAGVLQRVVDRLDDPLAVVLIGVAGGGRFLVRYATAKATGDVRVAQSYSDPTPILVDEPAGVARIDGRLQR